MITDIFCKILKGELKADIVYKDKEFWVVKDISPQVPVHLLIIPTEHFTSLEDFVHGGHDGLLGRALMIAHKVAHQTGIAEKGYRLIINEGEYGGKLVPHFHIHLLGGKRLGPKFIK